MSFLVELIRAGFEPFRARHPQIYCSYQSGSPRSFDEGSSTARLKNGAGKTIERITPYGAPSFSPYLSPLTSTHRPASALSTAARTMARLGILPEEPVDAGGPALTAEIK